MLKDIPTMQPDVLTALRQATGARHAELDAQTPLAASQVDLRAYRDHLLLLAAWLAPLQAWLMAGEGPHLPDYLRAIHADLAHASLAGIDAGIDANIDANIDAGDAPQAGAGAAATSAQQVWPQHASAAYRWGACYVVEGSQLGGAVLYQRLARSLAPHPLAYLRGTGSPGPHWQRFVAALRAQVTEAHQIEQACRGAQQAFDSLIALNRALNRARPAPGQ
jgi:heme oxygenase